MDGPDGTKRLYPNQNGYGQTDYLKIQWKNTDKIQHKTYKNWTKYKYIDPRIWENATMSKTNVKCLTPIAPGAIVELKLDGVDEPAKASKFSIPDIATDWGKHASELHLTWIVT